MNPNHGPGQPQEPVQQPIGVLEVQARGTWQVTTESGATYLFRIASDGTQTVTRTPGPGATSPVRADQVPLVVYSRQSPRAARGTDRSILLGDRMVLVLEPLAPDADLTVRITSPVTAITELPASGEGS